jgi:hypothetical protein
VVLNVSGLVGDFGGWSLCVLGLGAVKERDVCWSIVGIVALNREIQIESQLFRTNLV